MDIFREIDLQAVYSTNYARTRNTAAPLAASKSLEVAIYDPANLDELLQQLHAAKQDALVVGHSNTTAALAGSLAGVALEDLGEGDYDRLYQVVVFNDQAKVQLLHQGFRCRP